MSFTTSSTHRLLLIRHGISEGSVDGRFFGKTDTLLLPEGKEQVIEVSSNISHWLEDFPSLKFYTSPLRRATSTLDVLIKSLDLNNENLFSRVVHEFSELNFGEWEGETSSSLLEKTPEVFSEHCANIATSIPPGGESLIELSKRVCSTLFDILSSANGHTIVIVAHLAVNRIILCRILGIPLSNFFFICQDNASLNVIDFKGEIPQVRLING
ncbi:MAG: histidine phosphatase family protein [Nitrospinota bacterium]|nr:histidine phosphatase family protein [Nitrospinota bacterium]